MMPSPFRHPLAVLRKLIGLTQDELASLLGVSRKTVQAVELGNLRLSEKLALKIADLTGASEWWLLAGDPQAPIVDVNGAPYTQDTFEETRSERDEYSAETTTPPMERAMRFSSLVTHLYLALRQAEEDDRLRLVDYKIYRAICDIARPFRDFVPGFFGEVIEPGKVTLSIEYPEVLAELLAGIEARTKKVASEWGPGERQELAEYCGEMATVLRAKADEFQKLAEELDPNFF